MKLPLTIDLNAEQAAAVNAVLRADPLCVLVGKVSRVWANGDPANDAKAGSLYLELGAVPARAIEGMRRAIQEANEKPAGKPKRKIKP